MIKIFFAGTPDFAVPSLENLAQNKKIKIAGVFTQPARKKGRGQKKKPTPVALKAKEFDLPVYETKDINSSSNLGFLKQEKFDFLVVVAFGQIIGSELLSLPQKGPVNLHASLLPKYRGANPIQRAILEGEKETGLTVMLMEKGLDTGPVLARKKIEIKNDDTFATLHNRLAREGAPFLSQTLELFAEGKITPKPQGKGATYAHKLKKEEGYLNWEKSAEFLERQIRALNPFPAAKTRYNDEEWKIWEAEPVDCSKDFRPGELIVKKDSLIVKTGERALRINKIQRPGKKPLPAKEFLRGISLKNKEQLGEGE